MNLPTEPPFIFQRQRSPGGVFSTLAAGAKGASADSFQLIPNWLRGLMMQQNQRQPGAMPGASKDSMAMMAQMLTGRGNKPPGAYLTRNSNQDFNQDQGAL